ncbi:alpha-1,2-glucosyltransferase Alg10 [Oratosquilla oratoria]|uniref:alpha-1,2-glucosyltransferase Alg10 n=1 Tax=Oratosquilla oratoria TaxID=337810 RepID=UPI003F7731AA
MSGKQQQPSFIFPLVIGTFTAVTYVSFVIVYTVHPTPFIDEHFHIPQAQKYCQWKFFEWDPKITTLPGLYLFSIGLNGPVSYVLGKELCDVFSLRVTNLFAAAFSLSALHKLLIYLHRERADSWKLMLYAVNLSLLPVLHWFSFFYYTDVLATLTVLCMWLLYLHSAHLTAALMGVVAILMRQTNVVWVGMLLVITIVESFSFRLLKTNAHTYADIKTMAKKLKKHVSKPYRLAEIVADSLIDCSGYVLVVIGFVGFVAWNGAIVVGDHTAHTPTIHIPQLFYFCLFFLVFSLPYAPYHIKPFIRLCRRNLANTLLVGVAMLVVVHTNTLAHPYLLADNRHYTFYLWNRFYAAYPVFKYIMVPVYMFGAFMIKAFIQHKSFAFKTMFIVCLSACVGLQTLLEFRYFIVPFLLCRLQVVYNSWLQLWTETVYFLLINAITLYIFASKTFYWEDSSEPQRIIW